MFERPKIRCLDDGQMDLKIIRIKKGWIKKAQDQLEWMDVIRGAMVKL
jgi:hypothetical protein